MKKQYSPRRNSSSDRTSVLVWTFGSAFAVLALLFIIRTFLPGVFLAAATPLWKEGSSLNAGVGGAFAGLGNAQKLATQNTALSAQVVTLQNENAVLTARAQDLTKLLGGEGTVTGGTEILAGVLARPPESPYDTLVVAAGSGDGVAGGAQVFATGGVPLGTVQSVTTHSAIVTLLSTAQRATSGWAGENRTPITLIGSGAGAFTATLPKAAAVSVGDSVYVPGPGAVPVGSVLHKDSDPSSPTEILDIQPLTNIFSLTWVEIASSHS